MVKHSHRRQVVGTRAQVWHGTAKHTSGGLIKKDLMMNKHGRIVSRRKHKTARRERRLVKYGYGAQKGRFGVVKLGSKTVRRRMKGHRGGGGLAPLNPAGLSGSGIDGAGITSYRGQGSTGLQTAAGMAGGSGGRGGAAGNVNGNGIAGAGLTNFGKGSTNLQVQAGMAGGRRRRRRHHGGTGNKDGGLGRGAGMSGPLNAALRA
jgi:hypothetical protein